MIAETFCFAVKLAGLELQPAKRAAAPLWTPLSPEVQSQTRRDHEWVCDRGGAFQVSDVVKYLGVWLGPGATDELQRENSMRSGGSAFISPAALVPHYSPSLFCTPLPSFPLSAMSRSSSRPPRSF
eukprot:6788891-Pyramimonas_sp.AAC.1